MELDHLGVIKDAQQMGLDGVRVGRLAENLQESRVRDEEETWEQKTFLLKVAAEIEVREFDIQHIIIS